MKKLFYLTVTLCFFTFTSCINIIEEMFLNLDGTGTYSISIDMSGIMENGGMRSMMKQFGGEEAQSEDNPFNSEEPVEVDSIMYMKDAPDSVRLAFGNDELLNKIHMHQQISESKEIMRTDFILKFDKISEISDFLNNIDKLQSSSDNPLGGGAGGGLLPTGGGAMKIFQMAGKTLTRLPAKQAEKIDDEELGMMKMMLADATYKTIYHLPGKVKKTTMKNAVIDGKTITIEYPAIEAMEGKAELQGLIKFKKK